MLRIPAQRTHFFCSNSTLFRRTTLFPCRSRDFHSTPNRYVARTSSSDAQSSSTSKKNTSRQSLGLAIALSAACAFAGYTFGQQATKDALDSPPRYGTKADLEKAIAELKEALSEDAVSTDDEDLRIHGTGILDFYLSKSPHSAVVYPSSTEDVVKIVKIATKYRIPVMAYSGGTSIEGQLVNQADVGICVDMNKMNKILEIHEEDSDMVCQPAVGWIEINETLKEKGIPLFFPLDPGPGATVGGMLSTGCSGTNAVRYGTAKAEWFLNATVVLPSGKVIKTRQRARKSSAGFDITKLFIGAEGTLGIVTEVTIRLAPLMPTTVAVVSFPDVLKATQAATEAINQGVGIQCVELMDNTFMSAINRFSMSQRKWAEQDSLFFKFQGHSPESLKQTAAVVKKIVQKHGGSGFTLARDEKEAEELWDVRKNAAHSALGLLEGSQLWSTDVCVPVSNLPQLIEETKKDLETVGLVSTILGHVGDGNFHALLLFRDDEELERARHAVHRIIERAIELDGTCTGEHGVGVGKQKYLVKELGEGTVELMKMIKKTVDPLNLFNPGKLYPELAGDKKKDLGTGN